MPLTFQADGGIGLSVRLYYRHVNQAERWRVMGMTGSGGMFHAEIPGDYTASPYPLPYCFELLRGPRAWFYPAFNFTLSNQRYYAVWKRIVLAFNKNKWWKRHGKSKTRMGRVPHPAGGSPGRGNRLV